MMRTINTVSSERYSLDGVSYFKNYISEVKGNQITIFNCYDRKDVKLDWTDFGDIQLNGTVYASAILLQSALMPVIYTRNSLGGGGGGTSCSPWGYHLGHEGRRKGGKKWWAWALAVCVSMRRPAPGLLLLASTSPSPRIGGVNAQAASSSSQVSTYKC